MKHDQSIKDILPFVDRNESIITPLRNRIPPYLQKSIDRHPEIIPINQEILGQPIARDIEENDMDFELNPNDIPQRNQGSSSQSLGRRSQEEEYEEEEDNEDDEPE